MQVIFGQDGDIIRNEAKKFSLKQSDVRNKNLFDFVGFVIEKDKMLAIFPKHFFDENLELMTEPTEQEIDENVTLLFNLIKKYVYENAKNGLADKYMGDKENFESDYPFEAFFEIYDYYKRYGIYREDEVIIRKDGKGKISWKDTIKHSNSLISNGNIIFLPLYTKNTSSKDIFITQCMVYVINYTIKLFPYFLHLQPIINENCKIDFLANREYTLRQLYQYKNNIFKDSQKDLINSLIKFFEEYNENANGGAIHIKINYFDMIWEKMVNQYLNDYFVGVDEENSKLIFKHDKNKKTIQFESKTFNIDISTNRFSIRPDHYYEDNDTIYVFDSKYYENISDLNYKQFVYTIVLGNSQLRSNKKLYSALFLPGNKESKAHLRLDIPYCQLNPGCNYIIEQYLDAKLLMKNYMNKDLDES